MSATPKQMKAIRENPDPALEAMVRDHSDCHNGEYSVTEWWRWFNGKKGYHYDTKAFEYALQKAGMIQVFPGGTRYRRP